VALIDSYTSWGKASGGGGTIIGSPDVKAYNPPPSLPSSMATTTSRTRSFPERIDVNAIGAQTTGDLAFNAFATLGAVPGRTLELPFSVTNQLTKFGGERGVIDRIGDVLSPEGGIPFLNIVGHAGRFLNDLTMVGYTASGGVLNSADVQALKDTQGQPDSTIVGPTNWSSPFSRKGTTVGELKANLQERGFSPEDFADIASGRKSTFDYGEKLISTNPIAELGLRLAFDPTNAILLLGPAKLAGAAASGFRLATKGVGLYNGLVAANVATRAVLSPLAASRAFQAGQTAQMTLKGFGEWLLSPLDRLPALPKFFLDPRGYASVKGYTARSIGLGLGLEATGFTTAEINRHLTPGSAESGIVGGLNGLADDILNDRPLSESSAWNLVAAFHFPMRALASETKAALVLRKNVSAGAGGIAELGRLWAPAGTKNGGGWLLAKLGSRAEVQYLIDHVDRNIAFNKLNPARAGALSDINAPIDRYARLSASLDEIVGRWRAEGNPLLSNANRAKTFKEWFGEQGNFAREVGGKPAPGVRLAWDSEVAFDHWANVWRPKMEPVARMFNERGDVILKLQDTVTQEHLGDLGKFFRSIKSADGTVAVADIRKAILRYSGLNVVDRAYWSKFGLEDAKPVAYASLQKKLKAMEKDAPTQAEVFHESAAVEAGAPQSPPPVVTAADAELSALKAQFVGDPTYKLHPPPKLATLLKSSDSVVRKEVLERESLWASILYDGPLSPISRLISWARSPVSGVEARKAAEQAVYNFAIPRGATQQKIKRVLDELNADANKPVISVFGARVPVFRGMTALPATQINGVAERILGLKVYGQIRADFGGFDVLLDRASNRAVRALHTLGREGGTKGQLARVLESGWAGVARTTFPGHLGRMASKTLYHLFRFVLDPRWHLMNALEGDWLGGAKYGVRATGLKGARQAAPSVATLTHQLGRAPRQTEAAMVALELTDTAMGVTDFLATRSYGGYVSRAFDAKRVDSIADGLNTMGKKHPVFVALRQKFGTDDVRTMAEQLDAQVYQFDTVGVKATIESEARKLERQGLFDTKEMAPIVQKLYERNDQVFRDVVGTFYGNTQRSNIERIMNSYWLYWPLSYQLKAGKWLFDVMTKQFGGRTTNFAGAWTWQRLYDHHLDQMQNNPEYARMLDENKDIWFAAQMIFPITPIDMGVSLSRIPRYVGGALGLWGEYNQASNPLSAVAAVANMGPIYTADLLQRIGRNLEQPAQENFTPTMIRPPLAPGTSLSLPNIAP